MKSKLKLIPLLGVLPFFLMANSPYPYGEAEPYDKYQVSDLTYGTYHDAINAYDTQIKVKNTGEYFLSLSSFYISFTNLDKEFWRVSGQNGNCVCPGETETLFCFAKNEGVTLEDLSFEVYAYKPDLVAEYKSISHVKTDSFEEVGIGTTYQYFFEIEGLKIDNDYYYSMLVEYETEGQRHAYFNDGSAYESFRIETTYATSNPNEDIEIKNIHLIRGINRRARDIEEMWTVVWICTGIAVGAGLLISPAFIPLIVYGAKKRAKEEENGNS